MTFNIRSESGTDQPQICDPLFFYDTIQVLLDQAPSILWMVGTQAVGQVQAIKYQFHLGLLDLKFIAAAKPALEPTDRICIRTHLHEPGRQDGPETNVRLNQVFHGWKIMRHKRLQ